MAVELQDFVPVEKIPLHSRQYGRGYKRHDFLLTVDFLKQLCMDIKSPRCREVRQWATRL
jgi:phage anti-repressor protein